MEINADTVGPADVRINIYENCRGEPISILILIGRTMAYVHVCIYIHRDVYAHICTSVSMLSSVHPGSSLERG